MEDGHDAAEPAEAEEEAEGAEDAVLGEGPAPAHLVAGEAREQQRDERRRVPSLQQVGELRGTRVEEE